MNEIDQSIVRIDHLLGRNLIENLTVLRFSNLVFEPLWSRTYIHNIQVILFKFEIHFSFDFLLVITLFHSINVGHFIRGLGRAARKVISIIVAVFVV